MSTRFTISSAAGSSTQDFPGEAPEKVYFEDLQPGTEYSVTAELYYDNEVIDTDTKTFSTPMSYVTDAFYLLNETNEENTLTLTRYGSGYTFTEKGLQYSLDEGTNWTTFDLTPSGNTHSIQVTIPASGRVYLRSSGGFSVDSTKYLNITCSHNFSAHGNLQCLHNYKDINDLSVDEYEFKRLFYGATTLISAKYMYMPATTLAQYCYYEMFTDCINLTDTPELQSTSIMKYCYGFMFEGCESLKEAPALPATTLADYCYSCMFKDCSSLTAAPALPATTLKQYCYNHMFYNCDSLTEAPTLPATTLASSCYSHMFGYCGALKVGPSLPATTLVNYCYSNMFTNCNALQSVTTYCVDWNTSYTGGWLTYAGTNATNPTLYCPADSTIPSEDYSGVPKNWTRADLVTN